MSRVIGVVMTPTTVNVYDFGKTSCASTSAPDRDDVEILRSFKWDIYPPEHNADNDQSLTTIGRVLDYVEEQVSPVSIGALRTKIPVEDLRWFEIKEDVSNLDDQYLVGINKTRFIDNTIRKGLQEIQQTCVSCGMSGTALNYQFIILVNPVTRRFALAKACWMCQWKCIQAMWSKLIHHTPGQ